MKKNAEKATETRAKGLTCPSCGAENSVLDLRCHACGAFVRDRVPTLNLFSVLWGMIEAPRKTFLRVARSEQKNYVHVLFALIGPLILTALFSAARIGDHGVAFGIILLVLCSGGPLFGLLLLPATAVFMTSILRRWVGLQLRYRDTAACIAYGLSPLMWMSVIVLPLQLGIFGITLFSVNPPAWIMQPLPFWMLTTLDVIALLWSVLILPLSLHPYGMRWGQASLAFLPLWLVLLVAGMTLAQVLPFLLN